MLRTIRADLGHDTVVSSNLLFISATDTVLTDPRALVFFMTRLALVIADLIAVAITWASTRRYGNGLEPEPRRFFGRVTLLSSVLQKHGECACILRFWIQWAYDDHSTCRRHDLFCVCSAASARIYYDTDFSCFRVLTAINCFYLVSDALSVRTLDFQIALASLTLSPFSGGRREERPPRSSLKTSCTALSAASRPSS